MKPFTRLTVTLSVEQPFERRNHGSCLVQIRQTNDEFKLIHAKSSSPISMSQDAEAKYEMWGESIERKDITKHKGKKVLALLPAVPMNFEVEPQIHIRHGISFGIWVEASHKKVHAYWYSTLPEEWSNIQPFVEAMLKLGGYTDMLDGLFEE